MRGQGLLAAALLAIGTAGASAAPLTGPAFPETGLIQSVHHKPGHRGGPPWARSRQQSRDAYGQTRSVTRRVCDTQSRLVYDSYQDDYVRRRTEVCRNI